MRSCFGVQKQAIIRRFFFFASFSYPAHRVNETNLRTLRRVKHRHFCVLYQFSPYGDYFFSWVRIANYIQLCPSIYRHIVSSMNLKKKLYVCRDRVVPGQETDKKQETQSERILRNKHPTRYLGSFLSESVFSFHILQSLEIIGDMYQHAEALCHYS